MHTAIPQIVIKTLLSQPFEFVILLFTIWLYNQKYRGALLLSELIRNKFHELNLTTHLNQMYIPIYTAPKNWLPFTYSRAQSPQQKNTKRMIDPSKLLAY
jgi:hypothetical protein